MRILKRVWKSIGDLLPHARQMGILVATALLLYCILLGGMTGNERQNKERFRRLREDHIRRVEADRQRARERMRQRYEGRVRR